MRRLSTPFLITVIITAQLSCTQPPPAEPQPAASPPPTEQAIIDQILQRYEQALGGKEAIDAITSQKMKGRFQLAGMAGNVEGWRKDDYKEVSGVKVPFKVRFGFESFNFTVQVDQLEYNIPIDDAIFTKP